MGSPKKTITPVSLSKAREQLSPLVRRLSRHPVPISVRGEIRAYLVSKERFLELEAAERKDVPTRPSIQGTIEINGDLEMGSQRAAEAFLRAAGGLSGKRRHQKSS